MGIVDEKAELVLNLLFALASLNFRTRVKRMHHALCDLDVLKVTRKIKLEVCQTMKISRCDGMRRVGASKQRTYKSSPL